MDNRYSFTDLYNKSVDYDKDTQVKIDCIVIPRIQRPYAQGRTDGVCTYVRNTFLDEIFTCLCDAGNKILDLNFIYGIIRPNSGGYRLELLDGQQRLTTLYLLHWYVTNAELDMDSDDSRRVRRCLSSFLYETRDTSSVFCQELAQYKIGLSQKKPSEAIRKAKWYFKSFDRDSTICAMLTMLDAIHERYTAIENAALFPKLQNLQFYVKSLGVFNLSEELYIKMNARGLQLSPFENFKADLTNFISNTDYQPYRTYLPLYKKDPGEQVPFHFNFSIKLDAKWVDIFWGRCAEDFDSAFMSFLSRYFACKYIIASKDSVTDRDMRADKNIKLFYTTAEERMGHNEYFGFKAFGQLLTEHPEYIISLDKVLDIIYQHDHISSLRSIYCNMKPCWDKKNDSDGDDFYCNTSSKISHVKLIALGAMIEYIEAMPQFEHEQFSQWMRVVWNVIENTNIDSLTPVSSLIRKFSALIRFIASRMEEGLPFYTALSEWRNDTPGERENRAVLEEVEKARRIAEDSEWEDIWTSVERHPYFKGMVTFFYSQDMAINDYSRSAAQAMIMFDANGISEAFRKDHLLIRAIVSRFNHWDELHQLYITERAENNRYLKNILASNEKVRTMLTEVLRQSGTDNIICSLRDFIDRAEQPEAWPNASDIESESFDMAVRRLRTDIRMYDWIAQEELAYKATFRVYYYAGHIMFAIPRRQYAKIALDTERSRMAYDFHLRYGFEFDDPNQLSMYKEFNDCFGNSITLSQQRRNCTVWLTFSQMHEVYFEIECRSKRYAKELLHSFEDAKLIDDDYNWIQLPAANHYSYRQSYDNICHIADSIFDIVPQE